MTKYEMKPIWFFVGLILLVMGGIIFSIRNLSVYKSTGGKNRSCRNSSRYLVGSRNVYLWRYHVLENKEADCRVTNEYYGIRGQKIQRTF